MDVAELQSRVDKIDGYYSALKKQHAGLTGELKTLKTEVDLHVKASAILKHLLDMKVKNDVSKMAGLITYGLKTVFEDQKLSFIPNITKKNEKINIELNTENDGIEGEFDSIGGSVAVIESFLLRLLCILKLGLAKFLLLDETFAAVGEEYIPNTSRLIAELSEKLNMDILLVTHQKDFQNYAKNVYKVKESKSGLIMEKIK